MNEYEGMNIDGVMIYEDTEEGGFVVEFWYTDRDGARIHLWDVFGERDDCFDEYIQIISAMESEDQNG